MCEKAEKTREQLMRDLDDMLDEKIRLEVKCDALEQEHIESLKRYGELHIQYGQAMKQISELLKRIDEIQGKPTPKPLCLAQVSTDDLIHALCLRKGVFLTRLSDGDKLENKRFVGPCTLLEISDWMGKF